jgi:sensor histidine kinase YesM
LPSDNDLLKDYLIPPISLQVLLENAVKHNQFSVEQPLEILRTIQRDAISVCNEVRRKSPGSAPSNIGLKNLDKSYRHVMLRGIRVDGGSRFTVTLPLFKAS